MGITLEKIRFPVNFEVSEQTDSRFRKVKIWVAHTGENLNNSYFDKEVLEEMSKTLSGVPIVGFLEKVEGTEDETDFSDHRTEITIKEDGIKVRYAGHAYGFIPEDNNSKMEFRDGKEWLTTEGYVWTKFRDAMEIFEDSNGVKSQSMEIQDVEGSVDDLGRIDIKSAVFSALCILGNNVTPAMSGSTIEFFNKKEQYQLELTEMIKAFELEKGELIVEKEELKEFSEETEKTEEVEEKMTTEVKVDEVFEKEDEELEKDIESDEEEDVDEEEDFSKDEESSDVVEKYSINYELSHESIRSKIHSAVNSSEFSEDYWVWVEEVFGDHAIMSMYDYDNDENKYFKVLYNINESDEIILGEYTELFGKFLTAEEVTQIEANRARIKELQEELTSLQEFKANFELEQKEKLVLEFKDELDKEIAEEIRDKFADFSVEEIEKEIALKLFQSKRIEKTEQEIVSSVNNFAREKDDSQVYGSLSRLFNK